MNKHISFLTILLCIGCIHAQAPAIQWQKSRGGSATDIAQSIQPTVDGGYIIAGYSNSTDVEAAANHGGYDVLVVKTNASGTVQWQKLLGGSFDDKANAIQPTPDGGYVLAGLTNSYNGDVTGNQGYTDYWIVKLNASGELQWQKCLGGSSYDVANSIQPTADGGYIVAGESSSTDGQVSGNHGYADYWIVKLDTSGNIQWQQSLGGSSSDMASDIQVTQDGGYVIAGSTFSNNGDVSGSHGSIDFWVVKINAVGIIQWQKSLGGSGKDLASSIQKTPDSGFIVAGYNYSTNGNVSGNHGYQDGWIVKLDASGNIQWQKSLGGSDDDRLSAISIALDGGYIVAGHSRSTNGDVIGNIGNYDYWIVKLDTTGNIQWQQCLGGSSADYGRYITNTPDGGYVIAGESSSVEGFITESIGFEDYWVVKLGPDALAVPVFVDDKVLIYPNPVSRVLQVQLPSNIVADKVQITDMTGKVIFEQHNSHTLNVECLYKGIYMLEAHADERRYRSKFIKQ